MTATAGTLDGNGKFASAGRYNFSPRVAATRMFKKPEVQRRYVELTTQGAAIDGRRTPLSKSQALEEAMESVFGVGKHRGHRKFQHLAGPDYVDAMDAVLAGRDSAMKIDVVNGDALDVRTKLSKLRSKSDLGTVAAMLTAEYSGRNKLGEPRQEIVEMLTTKLQVLQQDKPEGGTATDEELAAALRD
jgi:hypothetical protein